MFNFLPPQAASLSPETDFLFFGLLIISALVLGLLFTLLLLYCIKYRRGSGASRAGQEEKSWRIEIGWTVTTLIAFVALFFWGADLYARLYEAPPDTLDIFVVGKQWMWKVQHPDGQAEIDTLHVPVDRDIRVIMASQDVIHSFYIPAFRIKRDVVPGRYESLWFHPTEIGTYALECSEFCGTDHARMTGEIVVMSQADYANWLATQAHGDSLAGAGEKLFHSLGCGGCHGPASTVHAPDLADLYGKTVTLADGGFARADDDFLRDAILLPQKRAPAGYAPVMPSFAGQLDESQILALIAYIKSLDASRGKTP
jgi:cytochrome c oxidase subunit 2